MTEDKSPLEPPDFGEAVPLIVPRPPRVWPSLAIIPVSLIAIAASQIALAAIFVAKYLAQGIPVEELPATVFGDVWFFVASVLATMATILAAAVIAGALSPERIAIRLGLLRPRVPWWSMLLLMGGTGFVWAVVMMGIPRLFDRPSDHLVVVSEMMASIATVSPLTLLLLIVVAPSVAEELLVRGYVQRGVARRWGPTVAVLASTLGFAILHLDPQHAVGVIPLGLWCGIVAWRTGSVFPAMLCHATNNGLAATLLLLDADLETAAESAGTLESALDTGADVIWATLPVPMLPFLLASGACLAGSLYVLFRAKAAEDGASAASQFGDVAPEAD